MAWQLEFPLQVEQARSSKCLEKQPEASAAVELAKLAKQKFDIQ